MLRAILSGAVVATGLFVFTPGSADAQFTPLAMEIQASSSWDVTVTGNRRVRCQGQLEGSDEPVSLRLEPEIGAVDTNLRRFYCGDIVIDLFLELKTSQLTSLPNAVFPSVAEFFIMINVVYDAGAGAGVTVYEYTTLIDPRDGWDRVYNYPVTLNTPGVVIRSASDRLQAWLTP